MKISAIQACTVGVRDLPQALALFRDVMRLGVEHEGPLSRSLLTGWGVPSDTTARYAELSAGGYGIGRLRLVEYSPPASQAVRLDHGDGGGDSPTDIGPKAIDFYVADPILPRVREIGAAGYRFRSPPIRHVIANTESEECLFSGPDGVPILLMVGHRHSPRELRPGCLDVGPYSEIATISVVAGDLEASRALYEDLFGFELLVDAETGQAHRRGANTLTGVPDGTRIQFRVYAEPGQASGKILLVHFFERTGRRLDGRMRPGRLGFSLMSHAVDNLDAAHERARALGIRVLVDPVSVDYVDGMSRIMLIEGPSGECFELVEKAG